MRMHIITILAGHPFRGWPARLRGHKGSGLWKVWTVPSPSPPLPSPPLPSPPLPSPPLPSLPPSFLPSLPPACHVAETAITRICRSGWASVAPPGDHEVKTKPIRHVRAKVLRKQFLFEVELRELWFESGLMNGPIHDLQGKWSECHRVRNAKRPREGSSSRTASYY